MTDAGFPECGYQGDCECCGRRSMRRGFRMDVEFYSVNPKWMWEAIVSSREAWIEVIRSLS